MKLFKTNKGPHQPARTLEGYNIVTAQPIAGSRLLELFDVTAEQLHERRLRDPSFAPPELIAERKVVGKKKNRVEQARLVVRTALHNEYTFRFLPDQQLDYVPHLEPHIDYVKIALCGVGAQLSIADKHDQGLLAAYKTFTRRIHDAAHYHPHIKA